MKGDSWSVILPLQNSISSHWLIEYFIDKTKLIFIHSHNTL